MDFLIEYAEAVEEVQERAKKDRAKARAPRRKRR